MGSRIGGRGIGLGSIVIALVAGFEAGFFVNDWVTARKGGKR